MRRIIADLDQEDLNTYRNLKIKSDLVHAAGVQRIPFDDAMNIQLKVIEMEAYIATKYGVEFDEDWDIDSIEGKVYVEV